MANPISTLLLGSGSPRRSALLDTLPVSYTVVVGQIDEGALEDVAEIAVAKFENLTRNYPDQPLLTADTLVLLDDLAMGKPDDRTDAIAMLRRCSNRTVSIDTAVCFGTDPATMSTEVVRTQVAIRQLSDDMISRYLDTGEADDKAGALALQGAAGDFIASIDGCWTNVVGLPVCRVTEMLGLGAAPVPCRCRRPD